MTEPIVLTAEELRQLTGYKRPSAIAAWLAERGWIHEPPRRSGELPRVDRGYYRQRMSGTLPSALAPPRAQPRLDFMVRPRREQQ